MTDNEEEEEFKPPRMSKPGRILFERRTLGDGIGTGIEWTIYDFDKDSAVFWIGEEEGFDSWLTDNTDLELDGYYVLEGVWGHVTRDYEGETDVDWNWRLCRYASPLEIQIGHLDLWSPYIGSRSPSPFQLMFPTKSSRRSSLLLVGSASSTKGAIPIE